VYQVLQINRRVYIVVLKVCFDDKGDGKALRVAKVKLYLKSVKGMPF
jgi:hypothetical protein